MHDDPMLLECYDCKWIENYAEMIVVFVLKLSFSKFEM